MVGVSPTPANAAGPGVADDCHTAQLTEAHTDVDLRLENHAPSVAEASGLMTVRVPTAWLYASDLLLSESSEPHRRAMRCLLRAPDTMNRPEEWRTHSPRSVSRRPGSRSGTRRSSGSTTAGISTPARG